MSENTLHYRKSTREQVHVTLTCGCKIKLRDTPYRRGAKYSCPSGMGHGYSLTWTSYTDTASGIVSTNPDVKGQ